MGYPERIEKSKKYLIPFRRACETFFDPFLHAVKPSQKNTGNANSLALPVRSGSCGERPTGVPRTRGEEGSPRQTDQTAPPKSIPSRSRICLTRSTMRSPGICRTTLSVP
ncbi:hypothetical protein SIID45300_03163 [Candidatus Magnetaquicoccaceae bacterium FCR-1]|uniref:Uncharacterized protein n=1 Tax=Candidatus Magnetaquiglobus chichijimensis TaxID=3141448 RepID=A0ABQ0CD45_9PROT